MNGAKDQPEGGSHGDETDYIREPGYAERYRDRRFTAGSGRRTHARETAAIRELLARWPDAGRNDGGTPGAHPRPWLDVPCGAGRLSSLLPKPTLLVDRNFEMVHAAHPESPRVCASVHNLPFADEAFGGAMCMRLLHHIPGREERQRILAELNRVTDGPLIVSFFHSISLQNLRRTIGRRFGRRRTGRSAVRWGIFRSDLAAAGLEVLAARPLSRFISEQWIVLTSRRKS